MRAKQIASGPQGQTAWEHEGEVFILAYGAPAWEQGRAFPSGARWESTLGIFQRYFSAVRLPQGWTWAKASEASNA